MHESDGQYNERDCNKTNCILSETMREIVPAYIISDGSVSVLRESVLSGMTAQFSKT